MARTRADAPDPASDQEIVTPKSFEEAKVEQEMARLSLIDQMREYFKTQPRRRVKVHNDSDVSVQVNGYTFVIQHGVNVDVPEDVADLLDQAGYI